MRSNVLTILMLLTGIIFPIHGATASVIKPTGDLKDNYKLHHRVIIYNDLSSYRDSGKASQNTSGTLISQLYSADDFSGNNNDKTKIMKDIENPQLTQFSIKPLNMITGYSLSQQKQDELINGNKKVNNHKDTTVGSFLNAFKDDPILQTIYFTSKDLAFGYKKTIANSLQLDFDMDAEDYKNQENLWKKNALRMDRELTDEENKKIEQEARNIFTLIVDSYKNILYVVLVIFIALYISFRYFLIKYI
ncbi:MAG: hypothetical protein GXP00_01540 [Alphaproteobacteria bacterium]|nr:hypothetical protein [Alphaproteobacteria bacterium]